MCMAWEQNLRKMNSYIPIQVYKKYAGIDWTFFSQLNPFFLFFTYCLFGKFSPLANSVETIYVDVIPSNFEPDKTNY